MLATDFFFFYQRFLFIAFIAAVLSHLNPNVCVVPQPQHTNVCFWYLPPGVRYIEDKEEKKKHLHKVGQL